MTQLSDVKTKAEISLMSKQEREIAHRTALSYAKVVTLILGTILGYYLLQLPDSILRQQSAEEAKASERVNLLLEWMAEEDLEKRANAIEVIRAVYGEADSEWVNRLESLVIAEARAKNLKDTLSRFQELVTRRREVDLSLQDKHTPQDEITTTAKKRELQALDTQINILASMLESYGISSQRQANLVPLPEGPQGSHGN